MDWELDSSLVDPKKEKEIRHFKSDFLSFSLSTSA